MCVCMCVRVHVCARVCVCVDCVFPTTSSHVHECTQEGLTQAGPVAEANEAHTLASERSRVSLEAAPTDDHSLVAMLLPSDVTHKRFGFIFADTLKVRNKQAEMRLPEKKRKEKQRKGDNTASMDYG